LNLGSFDDTDAGVPGQYDGMRQADKETVFDHPRNGGKRAGERPRLGNPAQRGIHYPVAAVRDENVADFISAKL
jgi:hypothetical protein